LSVLHDLHPGGGFVDRFALLRGVQDYGRYV
jgi:hypothetical protein